MTMLDTGPPKAPEDTAAEGTAKQRSSARFAVPEMWMTLAIVAMWLAVLFIGIYGPDIVSRDTTTFTTVPSAVVVFLFALFGTGAVARYGYGRGSRRNG